MAIHQNTLKNEQTSEKSFKKFMDVWYFKCPKEENMI